MHASCTSLAALTARRRRTSRRCRQGTSTPRSRQADDRNINHGQGTQPLERRMCRTLPTHEPRPFSLRSCASADFSWRGGVWCITCDALGDDMRQTIRLPIVRLPIVRLPIIRLPIIRLPTRVCARAIVRCALLPRGHHPGNSNRVFVRCRRASTVSFLQPSAPSTASMLNDDRALRQSFTAELCDRALRQSITAASAPGYHCILHVSGCKNI